MSSRLLHALQDRVLLADGAMGTQLQLAGLDAIGCGELWNVEHPDRVLAIQARYVAAGADCLITNTFSGCGMALERHGLADRVKEINQAAVRVAREAFGDREGFVLGGLGPFGGLLEPYGQATEEAVRSTFRQQVDALLEEGVDAILIETQTALEELGLAVETARAGGAPCVIGSMAYDARPGSDEIRTMMGVTPQQAAEFMRDRGVDVVGVNCGAGMDVPRVADTLRRYRSVFSGPTMAEPNAGLPELVDGKAVYRQTPEEMAEQFRPLLTEGVNILGACCGSTPDHIRRCREAVDAFLASREG